MIRLRRGTVGLRFTLLYAGVFLASGIGLLALAFLLSGGKVTTVAPTSLRPADGDLGAAQQRIRLLQDQLDELSTQHTRQLAIGSLIALLVLGVVSLVAGRALAVRVLRPLRRITAATRRITAESLDQRLAVTGPADEVKDLADTIDGLLERLEASFAAQRRFAANASHELRTPLATMRATLDVAVAKPDVTAQTVALADRMRTQLDRVDHLLDGFLVLARAEHGVLARSVPVDVAELVAQALAARCADITARRLRVAARTWSSAWTNGDPALLSRVVENLVDNAVTHNEPGGWITIETGRAGMHATTAKAPTEDGKTEDGKAEDGGAEHEPAEAAAEAAVTVHAAVPDAAGVHLVVETGGAVLDQRRVDRLTRPFERLGADRTGSSGLGLSIVAAVAAAHGGGVDLLARPGGGLRVTVTLPAVSAPLEVAA